MILGGFAGAQDATVRAQAILDRMGPSDKVALAVGDLGSLERLGIPQLRYADGPMGVRGALGSTAFPCALALAATFDEDLARRYGAAIASETVDAGCNAWLGPALDVARVPLSGRLPEMLGEDPRLISRIGAALIGGAREVGIVTVAKHFLANNFEIGRTGIVTLDGRGDAVDVRISDSTVREVYLPPFLGAVDAGVGAIMGSYNRVNGEYACQNRGLLDLVKVEAAWSGSIVPDFLFAVRDPVAAAVAGTDIPGLEERGGRTPTSVKDDVSPERLDDICLRVLWTMATAGLFDDASTMDREGLGSPGHLELAQRVAEEGTVLVRNDGTLPIAERVTSIAVIGATGDDAHYVMGGSPAVEIVEERRSRPADAIRERAGRRRAVTISAGTPGDVLLADIPDGVWAPIDRGTGPETGVLARYWRGTQSEGAPDLVRVEPGIALQGNPPGFPPAWRATWSGTIIPRVDGLHRFSVALAGSATLAIDGKVIARGWREAVEFMGPACPVTGVTWLCAGVPATVEVTFETAAAITLPPLGLHGPTAILGWLEPDDRIKTAAEVAARSDVAIVFVSVASSEGMDRATLALPGDQDELVRAIAAANPRTVVVVDAPGPVLMPWFDTVAAVLIVWYSGERFGAAVASTLFGDSEPAGRLPVTFPRHDRQGPWARPERYPGVDGVCNYSEGTLVGYRWYDAWGEEPLLPFGHGGSYTTFTVGGPSVRAIDQDIVVEVQVTNVGPRSGVEVIQGYVEPPPTTDQPTRYLVDWARVRLPPNASAYARIRIRPDDLRRWDTAKRTWTIRPGRYALRVGTSSRDLGASVAIDVAPDGSMHPITA